MGLIDEYIELAKKGVNNLPNVIEGNLNNFKAGLGILSEELKEEAERRYLICNACPFHSRNAKEAGFYKAEREDEHCSVCKCPLGAKVKAFDDVCGLVLLKNVQGYEPLWEEYKPKE